MTPDEKQPLRGEQWLFGAFLLFTLLATAQILSLGIFMLDVGRVDHALEPHVRPMADAALAKPFYARHNCFTSYMVAAELAQDGTPNLYLPEHYRNARHKTKIHATINGRLNVDGYPYPPPFLLLPQAFTSAGLDFLQARSAWYVLNLLSFLITATALVVWLGGKGFSRFWLVIPTVLAAPTVLTTLQIGNVHFFLICISILAMLAFETRRPYLGGPLLAFAILTKIFPGLLLVYLVLQRRWSALVWTSLAMLGLVLGILVVAGTDPLAAFISYQIPRLATGEAFDFAWKSLRAMLANISVMGVPFKLEQLGLLRADPVHISRVVVWSYTGLVLAVVVLLGLRHERQAGPENPGIDQGKRRLWLARTWLVLLLLGELRNPFLPWGYANVPVFWLLALLLPSAAPWRLKTLLLTIVWGIFALDIPLPLGPPSRNLDLIYTLSASALILVLCLVLAIQSTRRSAFGSRMPAPES